MTKQLAPAIIAYQQAIVDNSTAMFHECFCEDAVVTDNGKTYRGLDEITDWGDALSKIKLNTEITDVDAENDEATIGTFVTGEFEGSPLPFRYKIKLKGGKIDHLDIEVAR